MTIIHTGGQQQQERLAFMDLLTLRRSDDLFWHGERSFLALTLLDSSVQPSIATNSHMTRSGAETPFRLQPSP